MLRLVVQDDAGKSAVVPLVGDITIGRGEENTICLTERNVSRRHARIVRSNGHVEIHDLDSYNGVLVNGERIQGIARVSDRDRIQIGNYLLAVNTKPLRPVRNVLGPSPDNRDDDAPVGHYEDAYDLMELGAKPEPKKEKTSKYSAAEQDENWPTVASGTCEVQLPASRPLPERAIKLASPLAEVAVTTSGMHKIPPSLARSALGDAPRAESDIDFEITDVDIDDTPVDVESSESLEGAIPEIHTPLDSGALSLHGRSVPLSIPPQLPGLNRPRGNRMLGIVVGSLLVAAAGMGVVLYLRSTSGPVVATATTAGEPHAEVAAGAAGVVGEAAEATQDVVAAQDDPPAAEAAAGAVEPIVPPPEPPPAEPTSSTVEATAPVPVRPSPASDPRKLAKLTRAERRELRRKEAQEARRARVQDRAGTDAEQAARRKAEEAAARQQKIDEAQAIKTTAEPQARVPTAGTPPADPEVAEVDTTASKPEPRPAAADPPKGPLDARASISGLSVSGSLQSSVVKRAVDRVNGAFRGCYKNAASRAGKNVAGKVKVSLTIDETGRAEGASARGGPLAGIDSCVRDAVARVKTRTPPDVGEVKVSFTVTFAPL